MSVQIRIDEERFTPYLLDSIIYYMIMDTDFVARFRRAVSPDIMGSESERATLINLCYQYHSQYKEAPGEHIVDVVENYLVKRPKQKKLLYNYLKRILELEPNKEYVLNTIGGFVKTALCKDAIQKADKMVDEGEDVGAEQYIIEKFREAYGITGTTVENLLEGVKLWTDDLYAQDQFNMRTMIKPYDKINGGFYKSEMVLVFGDQNTGKTYLMTHLGRAGVLQGRNVLHITLETPKRIIKQRYAAGFTGQKVARHESGMRDEVVKTSRGIITVKQIVVSKLKEKLDFLKAKKGSLWIEQGRFFTFKDLVALTNRIEITEGKVPDVVIIDSPDQMLLDTRYKDHRFDEKYLYSRLLDFREERNITLIVTTQAGRQVGKRRSKDPIQGADVAETYDKIRIPDTVWTLTQTKEEYERRMLRLFQYKSRTEQKFLLIEIEQLLRTGQFVYKARRIKQKREADEFIKQLKEGEDDAFGL